METNFIVWNIDNDADQLLALKTVTSTQNVRDKRWRHPRFKQAILVVNTTTEKSAFRAGRSFLSGLLMYSRFGKLHASERIL